MSVATDEELSGAQAIMDISSAMLRAAGECLQIHGDDPNSHVILTAAVCLFTSQITKDIDPSFRNRLVAQLLQDQGKGK